MITTRTEYYRWRLSDQTKNHCPACRSHDGQVKTAETWSLTAMPALHPNCSCTLEFDRADEFNAPDSEGETDNTTTSPYGYTGQTANNTNSPTGYTGQTTNNPAGPPGLSGEFPPAVPRPANNTPVYPPATPPAVIVHKKKKPNELEAV